MSMQFIPLGNKSLFYIEKTGVCRGIPNFLIFDPKHTLSVLIRTASLRRFLCVPTMNILSKNIKNIKIFQMKFSFFFSSEKSLCILHGQFS